MHPKLNYGIPAAFLAAAGQQPDRPAYVQGERELTYRQLAQLAAHCQASMKAAGVKAGARVGIWATHTPETYAALLACWALRAAYVPLNPRFPAERTLHMARAADLRHIWAPPGVAALDALQEALPQVRIIHLSPVAYPALTPENPSPTDLAYLLFTSGSTGLPKGVAVTQGAVLSFFQALFTPPLHLPLTEADRHLQMFDLTFDLSVFSVFLPLITGGCCCPLPSGAPGYLALADVLEAEEVSVALMVPSAVAFLMPYLEEMQCQHLRLSLFCGEALPQAHADAWQHTAPKARLFNVYGPTEATVFFTSHELKKGAAADAPGGVVPIGQPFNGEVKVVDETGTDAAEGELWLGGPQLAQGYWQDEAKTAEAFVTDARGQRWYRTGDRVLRSPDGTLCFLGRNDTQVKIDGYRLELGDVEHHLRQVSGAAQVVALALPNAQGTTELHAVLEGSATQPDDALKRALAQHLPPYGVPRHYHYLPALPLNVNGKLDRPAIRLQLEQPH